MARLVSLEEKLDRIEKKNGISMEELKEYANDLARSIASFYQNNKQPLERIGEGVIDLCAGLIKAGKACLDTTKVFVQKAAVSAEKIHRETQQNADQLVRDAMNRAAQAAQGNEAKEEGHRNKEAVTAGRKAAPISHQEFFAGTDLLQRIRSVLGGWNLAKWCRKLSVSEAMPLHRLMNAFCATGLLLYLLLFYVLASDHILSFPPILSRLSADLCRAPVALSYADPDRSRTGGPFPAQAAAVESRFLEESRHSAGIFGDPLRAVAILS